MNQKLQKLSLVLAIALVGFFIGNRIYNYYTFEQKPQIQLDGLAPEACYKGELAFAITSENPYKIDTIKALLDGKPFVINKGSRVSSKRANIPVVIDTTTLGNGKHHFEFNVVDSSRHQNKDTVALDFYIDNAPLHADLLTENYTVAQGKTFHLKIKANKQVKTALITVGSKTFPAYPESATSTIYECFIPIDCEERIGETPLIVQLTDATTNIVTLNNTLAIQEFVFRKGRMQIDAQQKLEDEKDISNQQQILTDAVTQLMAQSQPNKLWTGAFELPIQVQQIITPHGEIRMTAVRGRYMHKGVDLINLPKSVVWAAQNGKVIIKDRFLMTGNTVVLDHGAGVSTLYAHLDDFAKIEVGDMLKKGNPLGKLGKTGYASGPHLHWELHVHGQPVDPLEWTQKIY